MITYGNKGSVGGFRDNLFRTALSKAPQMPKRPVPTYTPQQANSSLMQQLNGLVNTGSLPPPVSPSSLSPVNTQRKTK